MESKHCPFCEMLASAIVHDGNKKEDEFGFSLYTKYKVQLVRETYRIFPSGSSNRAAVQKSSSYKLKFCPMCGKPLSFPLKKPKRLINPECNAANGG